MYTFLFLLMIVLSKTFQKFFNKLVCVIDDGDVVCVVCIVQMFYVNQCVCSVLLLCSTYVLCVYVCTCVCVVSWYIVCGKYIEKTVGRYGNPHLTVQGGRVGWGSTVVLAEGVWVGCGVSGLRCVCTVWYSSRSKGSQCVTLGFFLLGVGSGVTGRFPQ